MNTTTVKQMIEEKKKKYLVKIKMIDGKVDELVISENGNIEETVILAICIMNPTECPYLTKRDIRLFSDCFSLNKGVNAGYVNLFSIEEWKVL